MNFIPTEKLPEDAQTCDDMKDRAKFYAVVMLSGKDYYIPVTREMKRLFKIRYRGKEALSELNFDVGKFLQDLIGSVYFQVRDTVGKEVQRSLSAEIKDRFEDLFSESLAQVVTKQLEDKSEK